MIVFFMEFDLLSVGREGTLPSTPEPVWESEIALPLPREV
jgi:hypothetical protein